MHIFIDESGPFLPPTKSAHKISCVAAVVIPSSQVDRLSSRYRRLLDRWGVDELKGSKMDEEQIASVISLLREFEVIAEVVAVDTGITDSARVIAYRKLQADKLTEHFTDQDQGNIVSEFRRRREDMLALSPQLMLQAVMTISLVENVLQTATIFFVQRRPEELGDFRWVVDAKNVTVTKFEALWSSVILPFVQATSVREPFPTLERADYSHFSKYYMKTEDFPEHLREAIKRQRGTFGDGGIDLRRILTENLSFVDSKVEIGLQLADAVASGFSRAMNGTLQRAGWSNLGALFVREPQLLTLRVDPTEPDSVSVDAPYKPVLNEVRSSCRPMFTPRFERIGDRENRSRWKMRR